MGFNAPRRAATLALALLLGSGTAAGAQSPEAGRLAAQFGGKDWTGRPGCAVASLRGSTIDYFGAFGLANLEFNAPIDRRTLFNVGSVSKQVTAQAVLLLISRGAIGLDDDVHTYLPWLPAYDAPITVRHLMNHTSGLRDYVTLKQLKGIADDAPWTKAEARELIARQSSLNYTPGDEYQYSNSGYFVLAEIVEHVSGRTLAEFARAEIFSPLGMTVTRFMDDHNAVVAGRADAYRPNGAGAYRRANVGQDVVGAGGLLTNIEDLARWDAHLSRNLLGIDPALFALSATGPALPGGRTSTYGFGLMTPSVRGIQLVGHNGSSAGYNAVYMRAPGFGVAALALCNSTDASAGAYIQPILDAYLDPYYLQPVPAQGMTGMGSQAPIPGPAELPTPVEMAAVAGLYIGHEIGETYRIEAADSMITFTRVGPSEDSYRLKPVAKDLFQSEDRSFTIRIASDGTSSRAYLTVRSGRVRNLVFERK